MLMLVDLDLDIPYSFYLNSYFLFSCYSAEWDGKFPLSVPSLCDRDAQESI